MLEQVGAVKPQDSLPGLVLGQVPGLQHGCLPSSLPVCSFRSVPAEPSPWELQTSNPTQDPVPCQCPPLKSMQSGRSYTDCQHLLPSWLSQRCTSQSKLAFFCVWLLSDVKTKISPLLYPKSRTSCFNDPKKLSQWWYSEFFHELQNELESFLFRISVHLIFLWVSQELKGIPIV